MVITLDLSAACELTDEQFAAICQRNRDLRLEKTAHGKLVIMPPTGGETGRRNASLGGQLWVWNQRYQLGVVFDSSTGFTLPNGATRAPDVAWVALARWQALQPQQRKGFIPLCPDFVIELMSPSDDKAQLQAKLREYLEMGLQLGWLIEPAAGTLEIYRPGQPVETLCRPITFSAEPLLPGFVMDFSDIFE